MKETKSVTIPGIRKVPQSKNRPPSPQPRKQIGKRMTMDGENNEKAIIDVGNLGQSLIYEYHTLPSPTETVQRLQ